jgi:hypothetical protein
MAFPRKTLYKNKNKNKKNRKSRKSQKGGVVYKTLRLAGRLAGCGPGGCFGNARLPLCTRMLNLIEKIGNNPSVNNDPLGNFIQDTDYINSANRCGRGEEYIAAYEVEGWRSAHKLINENVPLGSNHNMNYIRNFFRPPSLFGGLAHRTTEEIQTAAAINLPPVPPAAAAAAAAPVVAGPLDLNTIAITGTFNLNQEEINAGRENTSLEDWVQGEIVVRISGNNQSVHKQATLQGWINTGHMTDPMTRAVFTAADLERLTLNIVPRASASASAASAASQVRQRGRPRRPSQRALLSQGQGSSSSGSGF